MQICNRQPCNGTREEAWIVKTSWDSKEWSLALALLFLSSSSSVRGSASALFGRQRNDLVNVLDWRSCR